MRRYLIAFAFCILSLNVVRDTAPARFMLVTPTYDGSGYATHPDVLYFEQGWPGNGRYRYWMAFTPYPGCSSSHENPSVLVSDDGRHWFEPEGLRNPVVAPPPEGHYSDPDLFIADGKLWIFYRWSHGLEERIYAKSSRDGVSWSREVIIIDTRSESLLSPSVVVESGVLKMWYIDIRPSPNLLKLRASSSPEGPWSEPSICNVEGRPDDRELWHLDVVKVRGGYDAFVVLINKGKGLRNAELYFATSEDGINWRLSDSPVLAPSAIGWDNLLVYRSSAVLLEEREEGGVSLRKYALWYSACNRNMEWHIGYTEVSVCVDGSESSPCEGF